MIEIKNLTKTFGSIVAVDNLSLTFDDGIYGVVGQNGAGKSTLFRLISDIYVKDAGSITIDGYDSSSEDGKKLIFFLPDTPYFEKFSRVSDMLALYGNFYDIDEDRFYSLIDTFKLPRNGRIGTFSKGMLRQTFLALALSVNVKYLFLDEAFDGLDPLILEVIKEEILKTRDLGRTIIASSHNVNTLEKLVDTFVMITKGKITGNDKNENIGQNYVKFQALFQNEVTEELLINNGIRVVSFRKYGSICNIVVLDEENIEELIQKVSPTILLERVPIDINEIITLNMMIAKKEAEENENK